MGMLNDGVLPQGYYALSELYSSRLIPGSRPSVTAEPTLTIRRAGGRRIVAFLKILSPGTKRDAAGFQELVDRSTRPWCRVSTRWWSTCSRPGGSTP